MTHRTARALRSDSHIYQSVPAKKICKFIINKVKTYYSMNHLMIIVCLFSLVEVEVNAKPMK